MALTQRPLSRLHCRLTGSPSGWAASRRCFRLPARYRRSSWRGSSTASQQTPALLLAIYMRVAIWGILAGLIYALGAQHPMVLVWAMVGLLAVFYAGGGLGGVPYADIIGKVFLPAQRGAFFATREVLSGPLAIGAALLVPHIMAGVAYPDNYALLFALPLLGLGIASQGIWGFTTATRRRPRARTLGLFTDNNCACGTPQRGLVLVKLLTGHSLLRCLSTHLMLAQRCTHRAATGWYLLAQVGAVCSPLCYGAC